MPARLSLLLAGLLAALLLAPPAQAVAVPTALTLSASPTTVLVDTRVTLTGRLTSNSLPVAGQPVRIERLHSGSWVGVWSGTTGSDGTVRATPVVPFDANRFRAVHDGGASYSPSMSAEVPVTGKKWAPPLVLNGPTALIDERSITLTATWRTGAGKPVPGQVRLYSLPAGASNWQLVSTRWLDGQGTGTFTVQPRVDTRYRLYGLSGRWFAADHSNVLIVDNRPPGAPWYPPASAPRPKYLPPQARAFGAGANVIVSGIPDNVWNQMTGISWHSGCPVGRSGLRQVVANYWGFDGYRHRGVLIVNADRVGKFVGALRDFYSARVPIRAMYRVDRFGYSSRSGGADDFASMAHDNTSAFNCRWVTGNPGVTSPHSYGRSFDINPWENPYHSKVGWLPNSWWPSRSDARVAWRSTSHTVIRILQANGFRWTYGVADAHHFDGRTPQEGGYFIG